jgi:hypothetical protein
MHNWDRSVVNLPFGRFAIAIGEPIRVAPDADDAALESARRLVEAGLNATTDKAYGMVDGSAKDWRRRRTIVSQALARFPASSL